MAQPADPNNQQEPLDGSFDDDLGPNFGSMNQLPDANDLVGGNTREERTLAAIVKYESHHKGYLPSFSFDSFSHFSAILGEEKTLFSLFLGESM